MKCPPNSSPQGDIYSNPSLNLKDNLSTNANPELTTRWVTLRPSRVLVDVYQNINYRLCIYISGHKWV